MPTLQPLLAGGKCGTLDLLRSYGDQELMIWDLSASMELSCTDFVVVALSPLPYLMMKGTHGGTLTS
jgi:hypothetical protein